MGRFLSFKQRRYWTSSSVAPYCLLWKLFGWPEVRFAFFLCESAWATVGKGFEPDDWEGSWVVRLILEIGVIKVPSVVSLTWHSSEFEVLFFVSCGSTVGLVPENARSLIVGVQIIFLVQDERRKNLRWVVKVPKLHDQKEGRLPPFTYLT